MNPERDKLLTESVGECLHEFDIDWDTRKFGDVHFCLKCNGDYNKVNHKRTDFSTWTGFGKLWEWSQNQDWWDTFEYNNSSESLHCTCHEFNKKLINPDRFADAVYVYLKERRDND